MKKYPLNRVEYVDDLKKFMEVFINKYPDKIAFRYKEKNQEIQKSYKQFYYDIKCLGTSFLSMETNTHKIAVIGENSYEWIVTYFATVNTGNIIVPIDKELNDDQIIGLLKEAECRVFVYTPKYIKAAEKANELLNISLVLIDTDRKAKDEASHNFYQLIEDGKRLLDEGNLEFENQKINMDQIAAINFTSGTTGVSKGVMLSHKNLTFNALGALNNVKVYDTSVLILPIHHTFGFTSGVLSMLYDGTCICINNSMKRISSDLKYYKPDHLFLVPLYVETFYKRIWQTAKSTNKDKKLNRICRLSDALLKVGIDLRKYLFKSIIDTFGGELKLIVSGGAPLDPKYIKGFRTFGINILNGYGITECSPIVAVNRNRYYKDGSVGTALPCSSAKIHQPNEDGEGEIMVSGDTVMKGYYNNEQETEKVLKDGWFYTGDIGKLDKDGFLYITGRKKNIIIFNNGKNIYPEELEMRLMNIPFVKDALVYSGKDEQGVENSIIAELFIDEEYRRNNSLDHIEKELSLKIDEINKTIPSYKNISEFKIRETEFKKTSTKKIIRNVRS